MDYYTLKKLFDDLKGSLRRARLLKVFGDEKGISLKLRGIGSFFLNFVLFPVEDACFFKSESPIYEGETSFSQFLNNILKTSIITDFSEVKGERLFSFIFEKRDFARGLRKFLLTFQVVGKKVMLSVKEDERVLTFMGHDLTEALSPSEREFLWDVERERVMEVISVEGVDGLSKRFYPVPKFLVREIVDRFGKGFVDSPDELIDFWDLLLSIKKELFASSLWLFLGEGMPKLYPFRPLSHSCLEYSNPHEAVSRYIKIKNEAVNLASKKAYLLGTIKRQLRNVQRIKKSCHDELRSLDFDRYRLWAETILINLDKIDAYKDRLVLPNPYEEEQLLEIPYEYGKKPSLVAQDFFKKYAKLKKKCEVLSKRVESLKLEEMFLEEVLWYIEEAENLKELEEIEELLQKQGYIKKRKPLKTVAVSSPYRHIRWKDVDIYVGKNSRGNELVTFKIAARDDLWFHVKDYPGAHVILKARKREITPRDLEVTAAIAAYFSKAKSSAKVDVDYTLVKYVTKIRGAAPGVVSYRNYRTITVRPHIPEEVEYVEEDKPYRNCSA